MNKLTAITFDDFLARNKPFETSNCTFDISGFSLISPSALVQLAAACYGLAHCGRKAIIIIDDYRVISFLKRTGFITVIKGIARIENKSFITSILTYPFIDSSNPLLLEVSKIADPSAISELLNRVISQLINQLNYRKHDAYDVATAISEICQNIFDHNQSTCGFVAMQVYGHSIDKRFIEIGIADYGDGLTNTLSRNPRNLPLESDLSAIKLAIQPRVSEFLDDPTRGTGLRHMMDIAFKHQGTVQIRSGKANMRFRMDKRQGWGFSVSHMPGVQLTLTLKSKERLDKY